MHSTPVYRPPFEASSFLLEVTEGCSHNRCAFCTMYQGVPFRVLPLADVETQLQSAKPYARSINRVFLENGDPFALDYSHIADIASLVHRYLPNVETIAMYASIQNIRNKTDEQLKSLRKLDINELNIGVESGLDSVLSAMNKGYTAEEAFTHLNRLKAAGFEYGANIILGAGGPDLWEEHARETAHLLNETHPYLIFTGTIHADPGCVLYDQLKSGAFIENTLDLYLKEESLLLSLLDLNGCWYFGLHPSNIVSHQGILNRGREALLVDLKNIRETMHDKLDCHPVRGAEGGIYDWA